MLRSGALPASLTYLEERVDRPVASAPTRSAPGVIASLAGLAADRRSSCWSTTSCRASTRSSRWSFNLVILLGLMAYSARSMTLPGIAGFVLTMGIGVDSNVLIFERIKEELAAQRGVRAAVNAGFDRVFLTLLDTHVASLISAAFLFQFGTGPIRGFATTLSIGLLVEPVHVDLRVEDAVRARAVAGGQQTRDAQHLGPACHADLQQHEFRLRPVALARASRCRWVIILAGWS